MTNKYKTDNSIRAQHRLRSSYKGHAFGSQLLLEYVLHMHIAGEMQHQFVRLRRSFQWFVLPQDLSIHVKCDVTVITSCVTYIPSCVTCSTSCTCVCVHVRLPTARKPYILHILYKLRYMLLN